MTETERVLKVDVRGRVWTPRERREEVLSEFERSGMPASKFAQHIGVKYSTFANWVQRHRKENGDRVARVERRALKWVEAKVEADAGAGAQPLVVHLPAGIRMEVGDVAQAALAAEVLRRLVGGGAPC
jgi:transposase-like protein